MTESDQIISEESSPASFREQRMNQLLDECRNTILEQIIQPFGLSMAMFRDQDGGNVDTVHNVRNNVYATEEEKKKYDNRGDYDDAKKKEYHDGNSDYRAYKQGNKEKRNSGEQTTDAYTGNPVDPTIQYDVDHVIPAEQIHNDAGAVLAECDGAQLANADTNLVVTNYSINRSKQNKSMEEFISDWEKGRPERLEKIRKLQEKGGDLTEDEKTELNKLQNLEQFDPEKARAVAKNANKQYNKTINKQYYTSKKFLGQAAKDVGKTALTTAFQQALGKLLVDFVQACFHEVRMLIRERKKIKGKNIFDDLKCRMQRVLKKMMEKVKNWRDIAADLRDGLLAGVFSSLTTTFINIFATTAKRFVRAIREGFRSLVKTFKLLFFRPAEMTQEDAMKAIINSLSSVFVTTVGITAEAAINTFIQGIPVLGQFAPLITPVLIGILSGISIALISYLVDVAFDLFHKSEREFNTFLEITDRQTEVMGMLEEAMDQYLESAESFSVMVQKGEVVISTNEEILDWMNGMIRKADSLFTEAEDMKNKNDFINYLLEESIRVRKELLLA